MNTRNLEPSLAERVYRCLEEVGLPGASLVSTGAEAPGFGDSQVVFRLHPILIRVTRDRGQEFVDIGADSVTPEFQSFDDVEIGHRWRTVDEVLSRHEPEPIASTIRRISERFGIFASLYSAELVHETQERVRRAADDRGRAFVTRLRKPDHQAK